MKLIRKSAGGAGQQGAGFPPWRVLVVDDDPDVHALTLLNLRDFRFDRRGLQLLTAHSAAEAREVLRRECDIACALIDVIMESDDAGLGLVEYIRGEMDNQHMRLVIRTGQAGAAVERDVIENYDIDDFKDKTELTAQKLYTTVRAALKGYRDLKMIESNRAGLAHILKATPGLYNQQPHSLNEFFEGILTQIVALCRLGEQGMIVTVNGFVTTLNGQTIIRARSGEFSEQTGSGRASEIEKICTDALLKGEQPVGLADNAIVVPLRIQSHLVGYIYLEETSPLTAADNNLIAMFAEQSMAALENFTALRPALLCRSDPFSGVIERVSGRSITSCGDLIRLHALTRQLAEESGVDLVEARQIADSALLYRFSQVITNGLMESDISCGTHCHQLFERFMAIAQHCERVNLDRSAGGGTGHVLVPLAARLYRVAVRAVELIHNQQPLSEVIEQLRNECNDYNLDHALIERLGQLHQNGTLNPLT